MNAKLTRIKQKLTQREVCEMTGLSNTTLVKIEKGNVDNIQLRTLKKLAAALNSSVEELFLSSED
ncbi:helix-turn-helix domain-containing protein [Clostridium sulfidigenes]|uniref:helix-turn-helix domain-containing protein n=1 Tax=Clostridium sulfidigenes TaxID=318464 RepID=UPI003F88BAE3